jgi:small subunit ribosomal protein S2
MEPYIFTDKNGIYILDLKQTLYSLDDTYTFVSNIVRNGGKVLFVGTKKQAQESIKRNAENSNMPYVNHRWLGGMLTNFVTIRERVKYMTKLENMQEDGEMAALPKKEQILLQKELVKLQANLNGVRDMTKVPDAIFVVDTKREEIALHEAHRLNIPIIGMIDTNADPDEVDFGIPSNDDAIRSIDLVGSVIAEAAIAGSTVVDVREEDFSETTDEANIEEAAAIELAEEDNSEAESVAVAEPEPEPAEPAEPAEPEVSEVDVVAPEETVEISESPEATAESDSTSTPESEEAPE